MKLLIYSHAFLPSIGGVQSYVLNLAETLYKTQREKLSVIVITQTESEKSRDEKFSFPVIRKPSFLQLAKNILNSDLVHLAGPALLPLILSLIFRKPTLVEHHNYQTVCPNGLLFYMPRYEVCPGYFMKRNYRECLKCLNCDQGEKISIARLLLTFLRRFLCCFVNNVSVTDHVKERIQLSKVKTIYHGVPDSLFTVAGANIGDSGIFTFAYIGRFVSEKGLNILLESAKQLCQKNEVFRLMLIGDGPMRLEIDRFIEKFDMKSCVMFTGFLDRETLQRETKNVNVFILPSIMEETAGLAIMEQMMRGAIVLVSNIGGLSEVVDDAGLKFAPNSVVALMDAMKLIMHDENLRRLLSARARERARRFFHLERMVADHIATYREMMKRDTL